jgi:helicase MOV-10
LKSLHSPGTGKTVTIVEAIKQILAKHSNATILACAPSNSAVDLIASRLIKTRSSPGLSQDELFRLYAPSRSKSQVPDDLKDFIHSTSDGHLSIPTMARFKRFRVILTTCISASIAQGVGLPRGHFSHIFVDEAGQADG